jgi:hypothetical protein
VEPAVRIWHRWKQETDEQTWFSPTENQNGSKTTKMEEVRLKWRLAEF